MSHIIKLMRDLNWKADDAHALAKEWDISVSSVREDSAEASRHIRRDANPDAAGAHCIALLQKEIDAALLDGDRKNLVKLVDLYAKINNVYTDRVDVNVVHEVKAFNPRDARAAFYQKNNRIGDMTDTLNVEVIDENPMPLSLPSGDVPETDDEPF